MFTVGGVEDDGTHGGEIGDPDQPLGGLYQVHEGNQGDAEHDQQGDGGSEHTDHESLSLARDQAVKEQRKAPTAPPLTTPYAAAAP